MILTIGDENIFRAITRGEKTYEGRKWKREYESVKPGDIIVFLHEKQPELVVALVTDVRKYESVRDMVKDLWKKLVPFAENVEEALNLYRRFYSEKDPAVAFGIKTLSYERIDERSARKWLGLVPWK